MAILALLKDLTSNIMLNLITVSVDEAGCPFDGFEWPLKGFKLVLVNTVVVKLIIKFISFGGRVIDRNSFAKGNYWYRLKCYS